ncbi:MAG: glycoside hydrolase family 31 protein [Oscillospiraceae bacterium]|nr:glycoside hydrolase family 31 protein [Oscillospiraceae bacterium]
MSVIEREGSRLVYRYDDEQVWIEPWGANSLRVRATKLDAMPREDWALIPQPEIPADITVSQEEGVIQNGKIKAVISMGGLLTVYNGNGEKLLAEYARNRRDLFAHTCSALEVEAREFKPIPGGDYHLTARFESLDENERIYGMGQYQQPYLNLKGVDIELAHRNSQASVPFALSSLGYGLLWNNPGVGRAVFGKNITSFEALSTKQLDYWVTAGDSPAEIVERYASVTGTVPMMPDYAMGFWQCKLRYQTQEELLNVAREYKKRGLPISVIVVDFFHWPLQGDWRFDPVYWPDPDAMIRELKEMGIELMVSIWPTVDFRSENYREMLEKGYLIRTDRGVRVAMTFQGPTIHYDATNPGARAYLWQKAKKNYYDKGVRLFWLDEAEPEYSVYDFDNYRYHLGPNVQIGNLYPRMYAQTFYEGMEQAGQKNIINLLRCAWAGSQKYGALVWSGDIASSFESLRNQFAAGLNMGLAGIPWWTTDIGGFHGGDPNDPAFRELLIRWFQYGAFCPVMRLHGDREPKQPQHGATGGATCLSGADNEVWSFGEDAYTICRKYMTLRERMKPYIEKLMREAHENGTPVIRPLFYDYPAEEEAWRIEDQFMFGPSVLVAPILHAGVTQRRVYLPLGTQWREYETGQVYNGGEWIDVQAPLDSIPVFIRDFEQMPF